MKIEYKIKGITLDESELCEIHSYYEIACAAEYLLDNYDMDEENAIETATEVRRLMNKYGYDEEDAISEVLAQEDDDEEEEI